jgi:FKBP-type peptidyl-prolyl cis-trans isomerase
VSPCVCVVHRVVEQAQEVVLPNGIRYYDMRVGGGDVPRPGDLVVIDLQGCLAGSSGEPFANTFCKGKRPVALVMGVQAVHAGHVRGH